MQGQNLYLVIKNGKRIQKRKQEWNRKMKLIFISNFFGCLSIAFALGIFGCVGDFQIDRIGFIEVIIRIPIYALLSVVFGKFFLFYYNETEELK